MGKLLHFEFHKLIRQKSFYICLAVLLGMLVVSAETSQLIYADSETLPPTLNALDNLMSSVSGSVLKMILGVFIPLFVCEDFVSGTIRNVITRGYTRLEIFFSKLIAVLCACVIMTVLCMAVAYLVGLMFWGTGEGAFTGEQVKILLCQLLVTLAISSLFYAISTVLQKTGGAIAVCLVLPMVLGIILTLADTALAEKEIQLSGYWIESDGAALSSADVAADELKKSLLTALAYLAVTTAGSWFLIRKREY